MDNTFGNALEDSAKVYSKPKKRKAAKPKKKVKFKPKKRKAKKSAPVAVRTERLDMRLTKAQKAKIDAKAKKTKRTVTSIVYEAIDKIR